MAKNKDIKSTKKLKPKFVKTSSGKAAKVSLKKKPVKAKPVVSKKKAISAPAPVSKKTVKPKITPTKISLQREKKIHEIRAKLLKHKESLLNEAEVALNELPGQAAFPDLGDQATAETDINFMLRLRGREQRLLKKIDEALDRLESGTFGICEDCGEEIEIKRLEARPVATMCISCKTLQEEEEKLRE